MKSEEKYRLLFENSKESIFITTPDGRYLDINPAGVAVFGYASKEEMMALDIAVDIYADPSERKLFVQKLRESGYVKDHQVALKRKDGKKLIMLSTAIAVRDEKGEIIEYQGINHDITDHKQAEDALRESENWTRSIINALPIGMHMYRLENDDRLTFTGANPAADKILGIDHNELIGKTIEDAFPLLVGTEVPGRYREAASGGETWYAEQIRYHHGAIQGAYEVYAFQASPGNMVAAFEDITQRKRMDEALRQSEERFKRLVQNSNDIITLIDENGIMTSISGPLERVVGYKPEELTGKMAFDLIHPEDAENVKSIFMEAARQPGSIRTVEYRHRHKNGKWIALETVGSNLLHDPAVRAVVVNIRDISERNRLQEQLQQAMKMEAVGRLAGGVAHDFNNILTVISGNIELARMNLNPSDPLTRCLDQVMKASDSAATLTRQLLAFSRKQIIEPKVLSLNDLVRNVRQMLGRLIGENVELQTVLGDGLGSVKVDPGQFEQVLVNLAVNARDAMPEGGRLIVETANVTRDAGDCAAHPEAQPGRFVLLSVSDTGHGMSDEVKEHLFEPFFTTKGKGLGTGLGLATTFGVVKQAGGSIEVSSEAGRGTTFRIFLPLVEGRAGKLVKEKLSIDQLKGREAILLVEDEDSVRQVAMVILGELGYKAIEARNGEEALMLVEMHGGRIDLLMTDIVMPGMNGRELAERLTRIYPGVKVLFTSGYTEDVIVHHGVIEEHLNFIGKPYSVQALAGKIREVLGTEN